MPDKLNLLDKNIPLQERYFKFLLWLTEKNHVVVEVIAQELELTVSEVDVFIELGDFDDDEFVIVDQIGFDIGHLFIVVRAPKEVRRLMYAQYKAILGSAQPMVVLKSIVDEHSDYTTIEELVKKVSGECWKSLNQYLKQRDFEDGTISKKIRGLFISVGKRVVNGDAISEKQLSWIIRAIEHDHANSFGVFTNDIIKNNFNEDYQIFNQIHEHIVKYATN